MAYHAAYRNVKSKRIEVDGIKFASPGEAERYLELCIMKLKGEIQLFELQPAFELQPQYRKCCGIVISHHDIPIVPRKSMQCPKCGKKMMTVREIRYLADFKIFYSPTDIRVEDVKGWGGYTTPEFKLKRKLFEYKYPNLSLILLKRLGKTKRIDELLKERDELYAQEKRETECAGDV